MNWNKLKDYSCPKCGNTLVNNVSKNGMHVCLICHDFSISEEKLKNIVDGMYAPKKRCGGVQLVSENEQALSEM